MAKKYKNTVHKNPFRENRPKKNIPWKLICVISGFLALILITTLVLNALFGTRKLRITSDGGFYDKRSGITYQMAPLCYQPVEIIKRKNNPDKDVYAKYNDTKFYKVKDISAEKIITTAYDGIYEIYYNEEHPLPTLFDMNVKLAWICEAEVSVVGVEMIDETEAKALVSMLADASLYCDMPTNIDAESTKYLYFTGTEHPYLYYYVQYFNTADGVSYVCDSANTGRCVPIGDLLKEIIG